MVVNTSVVKALLALKLVSPAMLSNLTYAAEENIRDWLDERVPDSDKAVHKEAQYEALSILGIDGTELRSDVVHFWRIHEELFAKTADTYSALSIVLSVFGEAKLTHLASTATSMFTLSAKSFFALEFEHSFALLEVTAPPMGSITLSPEKVAGVTWATAGETLRLPAERYNKMGPGCMTVIELSRMLSFKEEEDTWGALRNVAFEKGLSAKHLTKVLTTGGLLLENKSTDCVSEVSVEDSVDFEDDDSFERDRENERERERDRDHDRGFDRGRDQDSDREQNRDRYKNSERGSNSESSTPRQTSHQHRSRRGASTRVTDIPPTKPLSRVS